MTPHGSQPTSKLDDADGSPWVGDPYFGETVTLLRSVRDHDFETRAELCDDVFGIVDLDQAGEIVNYGAVSGADLEFSVVEFRQSLSVGEHTGLFDCVATIVWKLTSNGWREARWHASLLSADIPEALAQ